MPTELGVVGAGRYPSPKFRPWGTFRSYFQSPTIALLCANGSGPRHMRHHLHQAHVSPLIAMALDDEGLFRDGAPDWEKAPKAQTAVEARLRAAKRLWRFKISFPQAARLAAILASCVPGRRCLSGGCPECGRAMQRWFVQQAQTLAATSPYPLISISLALAEQRTPEDGLHSLHTPTIKKAISYTLGKANDLEWVVGGIDLSLNDDSQKGSDIGWQPQLFAYVATGNPKSLSDVLRKRYPPTAQAPRPLQIKECDGSPEAFSYGFKSVFVRRIAYKDPQGRWNTRKVFLPPKSDVQAMCWMHNVGFGGRIFLKNIRMTRVGHHVELIQIRKRE